MKKILPGLAVALVCGFSFGLAKADQTTCSSANLITPEERADTQINAVEIDYSLKPDGFRESLVKEIAASVTNLSLDKIGFLVYTSLPDITVKDPDAKDVISFAIDANLRSTHLNADMLMDPTVMKKYGSYFFETAKNVPGIVETIQKAKKDFKAGDLETAFPNKAYELGDGRIIAMFAGCTPHLCAGTENRVAYDQKNDKAYVLIENSDETKVYIYGKPDEAIQQLLVYDYLYQ